MTHLYEVRRTGKPWEAQIYLNGEKAGEIKASDKFSYRLRSNDGSEWRLTSHVHGEIRPFSMKAEMVSKARNAGAKELLIRNHLFVHNGRFYALGGTPLDRTRKETLLGRRYIIRIDGFPFKRLEDVDDLTAARLVHHRGAAVGETEGLGLNSHRLTLSDELADIGLLLGACSYLLYSTG